MVIKDLDADLKQITEKICSAIEKDILILSRSTCDGLLAGSILSSALLKMDTKFTYRVANNLDSGMISSINSDDRGFNILIDFNIEDDSKIKNLKNDFVAIGHDKIVQDLRIQKGSMLNPCLYGIDGEKEISSSGLVFFISEKLNTANRKLSLLAVVSALAERQDVGTKKSLIGLNNEIVSVAISTGILNTKTDLIFSCLGHRPIHEALAYTISPFIEGMTWNKENCYRIIKNSGISTHKDGKVRIFSDISDEEKNIILDAITKFIFLSNHNEDSNDDHLNLSNNLTSCLYELVKEDKNSILHDGREFAFTLNSCIKYERIGIGIGICMGERNNTLLETEALIRNYKRDLVNTFEKILKERWRFIDNGVFILINGDGILDESNINDVSIMFCESVTFRKKLFFFRISSSDNNYKFYILNGNDSKQKIDIDTILKEFPEYIVEMTRDKNILKVPYAKVDEFISSIRRGISNSGYA